MNLNHLKVLLRGLGIFMLMMTSSPGRLFSAPAASNPARLGTAASLATFSQLDLYANIETVGVVVSGTSLPGTAELFFHQNGDTTWHSAHPLMRIGDGRLVGSLFGLAPATSYNIKVVDGATVISGSATTQPDELQFTPSAILHVSASAAAGGDGSAAAPFQTIQAGVNHAGPGTQVLVADGLYHEAVVFPASGTAGNWIQVKAQGTGAVLDGSQNRTGAIWTAGSKSHLYFTKIAGPIAYLARDQKRFYQYDNITGLNQGLGHNGVAMSEGWFFEASTLKLWVRSLGDPADHSWQIPTLNYAFDANGRDWLWIEGFEMRFYGVNTSGCGVCTVNASHLVVRKNKIHNLQLGIFFDWNGTDTQGNDTRVEFNEIYDPPVNEWPWAAVKGSSMEGTAIVVRGHIGAIVRGNELHNFFNGIYTGSSSTPVNSALAFDADIYNNHIHHMSDDALEPEGASINQRFRNNIVDTVFVGMSLAPITQGPTWVLRSSFTNYSGRGFKWDGNPAGIVLIYQNTAWSNAAGIPAMDMISTIHNAVLRNNIFQSNGFGVNEVATGSTGQDWKNDNWYVTRAVPHFKWENVSYNTLAALCAATGLECTGYETAPGFVNPSGGDFTLLSSSPNIDRGIMIPGINDDFSGTAPDVGAFEYISGFSPTISGNAGISGATLSYDNGGLKTATADGNGDYSFKIPNGWSGTVTPSKSGYTFSPVNKTYNMVTADISGENYVATAAVNFKLQAQSQGSYDGWILESTETSGKGGTMNATTASFQLGDDAGDRQYRAILSFNTAGLPDNAIISAAVIKIEQKAAPTGANPFSVLGSLLVDVRAPYFGSAATLQLMDFNFAASKTRVGTFNSTPVGAWYSAALNADGLNSISKTSLTQFRLYFTKDDNDNRAANFMKFASGNAAAADRPVLIITYKLP